MSPHPPTQSSSKSSSVTTRMTSFVGCVRNFHMTCDASRWPGLQLYKAADVERNCRDPCATSTSLCANSGRCTSNYVTATCDCYGTGFEGPRCQSKGLPWRRMIIITMTVITNLILITTMLPLQKSACILSSSLYTNTGILYTTM